MGNWYEDHVGHMSQTELLAEQQKLRKQLDELARAEASAHSAAVADEPEAEERFADLLASSPSEGSFESRHDDERSEADQFGRGMSNTQDMLQAVEAALAKVPATQSAPDAAAPSVDSTGSLTGEEGLFSPEPSPPQDGLLGDLTRPADADISQDGFSAPPPATDNVITLGDGSEVTSQGAGSALGDGSPQSQQVAGTTTGSIDDDVEVFGDVTATLSDTAHGEMGSASVGQKPFEFQFEHIDVTNVQTGDAGEGAKESLDLRFGTVEPDYGGAGKAGQDGDSASTGRMGAVPYVKEHRLLILALVVVIVAVTAGVIVGTQGGNTPQAPPKTSGHESTAASESLPTLIDRPLDFTAATGGPTGAPSSYTVTLRPGSSPGQFVETDAYPATNSRQITTESFSSSGVEVTALENASPSGTTNFQFTTPLPVVDTPYVVGHSWSATSDGTSTSGQDSVQVSDQIVGVKIVTLAGTTQSVIEVKIHHVITESGPSGTVSQTSTGTEDFSPRLGVFVSGQSTEVTGDKSTTNTFRLLRIGAPGSAAPPSQGATAPSNGTSGHLSVNCPNIVTQGQSIQITITTGTPGEPVTVTWTLPNGSSVEHTAIPNSTDPTAEHDAIGTSQAGTWRVVVSGQGQTATCSAITVNGG